MTAECCHPICLSESTPGFVGRSEQSRLVRERSARRHPISPRLGAATGKDLLDRCFEGKAIPAGQHLTHVLPSPTLSFSRNSATRLAAIADRYLTVDRISSIGRISMIDVLFAKANSEGSIGFPFTIRSVSAKRRGTGATLPTAMRTSSTTPPPSRPSAARHTLEIA